MDLAVAARALFDAFNAALAARDARAFAALCAEDVAPEIALFDENAARLAAHGHALRLAGIDEAGDVVTLRFTVRDGGGAIVDEGRLVATREGAGLKIRAL